MPYGSELHVQRPGSDAPPAVARCLPPRAVFLHTGWRSGGTWIWSRCREQDGVRALYEPLHEQLARLRAADIAGLRPDSWASNHSQTAPYFHEYGLLLQAGARGLPLHRRRFAFDRFFLSPEQEDDDLQAYIDALLASAMAGQVSVLKFCRSLGRVGWLERRYPQALHAVVLRDPVSQWASARRLLAVQRNRYFSVAPLMVLARNADHPLVRQACAALDVRLPALHSDNPAYVTEACWRHFKREDQGTRYRGFLAFWTATALQALHGEALVVDPGRMGRDGPHCATVERAFRAAVGPGFSLAPRTGAAAFPADLGGAPDTAEIGDVHAAAGALVRAQGGCLTAERRAILLAQLGCEGAHRAADRLRNRSALAQEASATPALPRGALGRMIVAALVLAARALQPVRRAHGRLSRRRTRLSGGSLRQIT